MLAKRRGCRMIMEIISWFVTVYVAMSFSMAIVVMITNYRKLQALKWWEQILFFALQPILAIREGLK